MKPFLLFALCTVVLANSCKQKPTEPIPTVADTTSHNFTWHLQTFGDFGSSSTIFDVAIINDSLAYAVGEIYLQDSTGHIQPTPYNLAKWDGHTWQLERRYYTVRLLFPNSGGDPYLPASIRAVFAFSENDVWIAAGTVQHWDGTQWQEMSGIAGDVFAGGSTKIWGKSALDMYFAGYNGSIAHYDGVSWNKIPSGTSLDIQDIFGATDSKTGQTQILAVASRNYPSDRAILRIQNNSVTTLSYSPIQYDLIGVWFIPNQQYYLVGSGVFQKNRLTDAAWTNRPSDITTYFTEGIRGLAANDIFVVGDFGEVLHWNGASWKSYITATGFDGRLTSVAIKGNLVIAVGSGTFTDFDARGVIAIGKRTK